MLVAKAWAWCLLVATTFCNVVMPKHGTSWVKSFIRIFCMPYVIQGWGTIMRGLGDEQVSGPH